MHTFSTWMYPGILRIEGVIKERGVSFLSSTKGNIKKFQFVLVIIYNLSKMNWTNKDYQITHNTSFPVP